MRSTGSAIVADRSTLAVGRPVFLRNLSVRDREPFLARTRASRRLHRPWIAPPITGKAFDDYVSRNRRADFKALLVCRREDGAIVGVWNLSQIFLGPFQNAYLGFYALAPYAGQGYMAEGLQLVLAYAFRRVRLHRLEANIQPANQRSIRLVRAAGFRREGLSPRYLKVGGRWRDHQRWAITAEDWRQPRPRP